jgi:hypothetical protein
MILEKLYHDTNKNQGERGKLTCFFLLLLFYLPAALHCLSSWVINKIDCILKYEKYFKEIRLKIRLRTEPTGIKAEPGQLAHNHFATVIQTTKKIIFFGWNGWKKTGGGFFISPEIKKGV